MKDWGIGFCGSVCVGRFGSAGGLFWTGVDAGGGGRQVVGRLFAAVEWGKKKVSRVWANRDLEFGG